jgi:hypothetical protein
LYRHKVVSTADVSRENPPFCSQSVLVKATRTWCIMRSLLNIQLSSYHFKDGSSVQRVCIHLGSRRSLTRISDVERVLVLWCTLLCTQMHLVAAYRETSLKGSVRAPVRTFALLTPSSRTFLGQSIVVRF